VAVNSHFANRTLDKVRTAIAGADPQWRRTVARHDMQAVFVLQGILITLDAILIDFGVTLRVLITDGCVDYENVVYPFAGCNRVLKVAADSLAAARLEGVAREAVWPLLRIGPPGFLWRA
jgi:hypothetical protein